LKLRWLGFTAVLALSPGIARADRLIWIPTAGISRLAQAEYMGEADGDRGVLTGQIGLAKQFELMVRHYRNFERNEKTELGGQFTLLPEGFATPGIAFGIWDLTDDGPRGRRLFGVISKALPLVNKLPVGFHDIRVHVGIGSSQLSGLFLGGEAGFPFGFRIYGEYDTRHVNAGLSWSPIGLLRLKAESWGGKLYVGVQLRAPL
jgi:hypothetical protein